HSAVLVAAIDITDRKRAEEEVRQTKAFLNAVIESVPVPITVKEAPELRYILANRATETLFGLTRDQIIGKSVHDLFPQDMADDIPARTTEVMRTGKAMMTERSQFHTLGTTGRCVISRRIPIPGADGKSRHLLGVLEDITERKNAEAQIVHMARHDALSGLANRAHFTDELEQAAARCRRLGEQFAVHMVDLDRFKEINDSLGHPAGDAIIKEAAQRLLACVRETDTVARLGGDEFAILQIVESNPRENAIVLAGR